MKTIVYTQHALTALAERGLSREWVESIVRAPQWTEPAPDDSQVLRYFGPVPERGGRFLRVAVVETITEFRIVTLFLDRRARPK